MLHVTGVKLVDFDFSLDWQSLASLSDRTLLNASLSHLLTKNLAFWTGYTEIVLVAAYFLKHWAVNVSGEAPENSSDQPSPGADAVAEATGSNSVQSTTQRPLVRAFPRRWLDINGQRIGNLWKAACRAVVGVVVFHPGIAQASTAH